MLALLGLLGLTVAGLAFMPTGDDEDGDATPAQATPDTPEDMQTEVIPLSDLFAEPEDDTAPEPEDGVERAGQTVWESATGTIIFSGDAPDDVTAGDGNDYIATEDGDDTAEGGAGNDEMHGGRDDDTLSGGDGDDSLYGHVGDDVLRGGDGDDELTGGDGADQLFGEAGDDSLLGYLGDDTLVGGAGIDVLHGGEGADLIDGTGDGAEADYLNGGAGDDLILAGAGDHVSGGTGADTLALTDTSGPAELHDFDPVEDVLQLHYDAAGAAPTLSTESDGAGTTLLADGIPVATLHGVPEVDVTQVVLVPV